MAPSKEYIKAPAEEASNSLAPAQMEESLSIPNSTMCDMAGAGDDKPRSSLDALLRSRLPQGARVQEQIPAAEREAERLSAGIHATTPDEVKSELGDRLGADFSAVRFHSDDASAATTSMLGADAYTARSDVYFGASGFDPGLAAHELVHTAQQGAVASAAATMSTPAGGVQRGIKNVFRSAKKLIQGAAGDKGVSADSKKQKNKPPASASSLSASTSVVPGTEDLFKDAPPSAAPPPQWKMGDKGYIESEKARMLGEINKAKDFAAKDADGRLVTNEHMAAEKGRTDQWKAQSTRQGVEGVRNYAGPLYPVINRQARTGNREVDLSGVNTMDMWQTGNLNPFKSGAEQVEDAYNTAEISGLVAGDALIKGKAAKTASDAVVARGVTHQIENKSGEAYADPSFLSTSYNEKQAKRFMGGKEMQNRGLLYSYVPKGTRATYLDRDRSQTNNYFLDPRSRTYGSGLAAYDDEEELLFAPGQTYRQLGSSVSKDAQGDEYKEHYQAAVPTAAGEHRMRLRARPLKRKQP